MKRTTLVLLALTLAASVASAYNIKLKDGSIIFARSMYEVKGTKAIITLPNGTVTQLDLESIDVPGTEQYNKDNPGNVIAIVPGEDKDIKLPVLKPPPTYSLQEMLRQRKTHLGAPPAKNAGGAEGGASGTSWQAPEPAVELAFRRVLDGAAISQYRLTSYRGRLRLLATANSEEAVFNMLSASARAVSDLQEKGKGTVVEIIMTTPAGDSAGSFEMSPESARELVNGTVGVADYFIKNVIL
jgi:hypothetical protein